MHFIDLLKEKFETAIKKGGKYIEVFVDPTWSEIESIIHQADDVFAYGVHAVRFGAEDKPNGKIYAWRGDVIHPEMRKSDGGKLPFNYGWYYDPAEGKDTFTHDGSVDNDWEDVKYQKQLLKKIKKLYGTKIKKLKNWEGEQLGIQKL
jgi:hypothetical protein